jgi:hypothetical protein
LPDRNRNVTPLQISGYVSKYERDFVFGHRTLPHSRQIQLAEGSAATDGTRHIPEANSVWNSAEKYYQERKEIPQMVEISRMLLVSARVRTWFLSPFSS